jgi:hypothetical protein
MFVQVHSGRCMPSLPAIACARGQVPPSAGKIRASLYPLENGIIFEKITPRTATSVRAFPEKPL